MDVSIIIINYKTKELTKDCILSVFEKTTGLNYEIIVVDNASNDGSFEFLSEEFKDKQNVKIIKSEENLGFGRGNNLGFDNACGKYLFCLNSDTILLNNAVKIMFDFMEKPENKKVGVVGGQIYDENMQISHAFQKLPSLLDLILTKTFMYKLFRRQAHHILDWEVAKDKTKQWEVGYITGAQSFIRADVIKKVGGYSPEFFMYYEDPELQNRIKKAGYRRVFIPQPEILHLNGRSYCADRSENELKSCIKYYELCYGKFGKWLCEYVYKKKES